MNIKTKQFFILDTILVKTVPMPDNICHLDLDKLDVLVNIPCTMIMDYNNVNTTIKFASE